MKYEFKKILHFKILWIVFFILLSADLVLLGENASHLDSESEDYVYTADDYRQFLAQIPEQTKEFLQQPAYKDHKTFLYRNLMKTEADYADLDGTGFVKGKYAAFNRYAAYPYHLLFVILFSFIAVYQMIPAERRKGYFLLLKSTRKGHAELYSGKAAALSILTVVFSLLCDMGEILVLRYRYGGFHFGALIQSASAFRNCPYAVTVGQGVALLSLERAMTAVFCVLFIMMLFSVFKRNEISLAVYAAFFVAEFLFSETVSISSDMSFLAAVNPFYQSYGLTMLGNYLNVDLFGYPVSQLAAEFIFTAVFCVAFFACGVVFFSESFQIENESIFEKMMQHFRKKTSVFWHTSRSGAFETGKILIHEKRILVVLLFAFIILGFGRQAVAPILFSKADDAEYHRLASHVQGKVTLEKLGYIKKQRKYLDDLLEEAEKLGDSQEDQARSKYIQFEFENKDGGLSKLEGQRDAVMAERGVEKYFFDEAALEKQFTDVNTDLFLFMTAGIVLVIILCGLESFDSSMYPLLNTTAAGFGTIHKNKVESSFIISLVIFVLWNIPDLLTYFRIDHGKDLLASLSLLTNYAIRKPVTELLFFIILAAVRYAVFMAFTAFILKLTVWYKNQAAVGVTGVLVILMTALICFLLKTDVVDILIRIFTKVQPV